MDAKEGRERERCINGVILGKRPQMTVFQIDVPTCDSIHRNSTLAIYTLGSSKLSPCTLEELFSIFTLRLLCPVQLIAFPVVHDSFINSH